MRFMTRIVLFVTLVLLVAGPVSAEPAPPLSSATAGHLGKLHLYLMAGDYRRALELSQREIDAAPSAASYIYLTYVYHAIDAHIEHLSQEERWTAVEHLYLNLAYRDTEDLIDPPGGLARMAKEMIQVSVRQQSDVTAAMAARLDKSESDRLWTAQTHWRAAHPKTWWQGVPPAWRG